MNETMRQLLLAALHDEAVKTALLATREADDPSAAFCECATRLGYPVTVGELFGMGEEFNAAMLRSVNGGGVEGPDGWGDAYEMFFAALL
jgi:hypothetical protein